MIIHLAHSVVGSIIIVVAYIIFVCTIKKNNGLMISTGNADEQIQFHNKEMKMVLTVVTLFYICWIPTLGYNFWVLLLSEEGRASKARALFMNSAFFCGCFNSIVNPLIYAGFIKLFRKRMKKALTCAKAIDNFQNSESTSPQVSMMHLPAKIKH